MEDQKEEEREEMIEKLEVLSSSQQIGLIKLLADHADLIISKFGRGYQIEWFNGTDVFRSKSNGLSLALKNLIKNNWEELTLEEQEKVGEIMEWKN